MGRAKVRRNPAFTITLVILGPAVAGRLPAQDLYEFRFAFGTYCG